MVEIIFTSIFYFLQLVLFVNFSRNGSPLLSFVTISSDAQEFFKIARGGIWPQLSQNLIQIIILLVSTSLLFDSYFSLEIFIIIIHQIKHILRCFSLLLLLLRLISFQISNHLVSHLLLICLNLQTLLFSILTVHSSTIPISSLLNTTRIKQPNEPILVLKEVCFHL